MDPSMVFLNCRLPLTLMIDSKKTPDTEYSHASVSTDSISGRKKKIEIKEMNYS
jgi:hypothetical protein